MCEIKNSAKNIEIAKNHDLNADESSIIKQHAVEVFKHTHTFNHIINIEIN